MVNMYNNVKDGANIECVVKRKKLSGKKVPLIDALIAYYKFVVARVMVVVGACAWAKAMHMITKSTAPPCLVKDVGENNFSVKV